MSRLVRLTMVGDEGAAEILCGMLRSEGIRCFHRTTDVSGEAALASIGQWREIVVAADDLERARELVDAVEAPVEECVRCGRPVDREGGWFADDEGVFHPYCGVCAERIFGAS